MNAMALVPFVLLAGAPAGGPESAAGERPALPTVRMERPRIFLRRGAWDGPSIEKIKSWMKRPEYQDHWKKVVSYPLNMNYALQYILAGDTEAGQTAIDRYRTVQGGGTSPSYWGIKDQAMAACYDWLYDHPGFTDEIKAAKLAQLERRCAANMDYLKNEPENPFYSRFAGALAGLTACALSMYGDSPKAEEYLRFAFDCLREKMGTIRQAEDGATGGACYGYHHEFTDLANLVGCWRSATDFDAAKWIKERQGNWLERQMLFQIWMTYPNGAFVKDGDVWGRDTRDDRQYRMQIDAITGMYRNGIGRTWADGQYRRWGADDYHSEYVWEFFVFNDPEVAPRPLSDLGRAAAFAPKYQGIVAWRSDWTDSAAIVHFRAGESGDTHSTWDQGKFIIYRERPLAIKNGAYIKFMDAHHKYYKSPWSANSVLFTRETAKGRVPVLEYFPSFKFRRAEWWPKGLFPWDEWVALRETHSPSRVMGTLLETESNDRYARAVADLSYVLKAGAAAAGGEAANTLAGEIPPAGLPAAPPRRDGTTRWVWTRELVFLDYAYLLVLDRVKAFTDEAGNPILHTWTLHTTYEPRVEGTLAVAENGPARLFARTLLPEKVTLTKVGGPGKECEFAGTNPLPSDWTALDPAKLGPSTQMGAWRLDVEPAARPAPGEETVYLHVLFPTDIRTAAMPACAVERRGADLAVKVGGSSHTFRLRP